MYIYSYLLMEEGTVIAKNG